MIHITPREGLGKICQDFAGSSYERNFYGNWVSTEKKNAQKDTSFMKIDQKLMKLQPSEQTYPGNWKLYKTLLIIDRLVKSHCL